MTTQSSSPRIRAVSHGLATLVPEFLPHRVQRLFQKCRPCGRLPTGDLCDGKIHRGHQSVRILLAELRSEFCRALRELLNSLASLAAVAVEIRKIEFGN